MKKQKVTQVNIRPPSHAALTMDIHDERSPGQQSVTYKAGTEELLNVGQTTQRHVLERKKKDQSRQNMPDPR